MAGLIYDGFSILRKGRLCAVSDILFGLICGVGCALCLASARETALRLPMILFFLLGLFLYREGIGKGIRFCFRLLAGRKSALPWRKKNG